MSAADAYAFPLHLFTANRSVLLLFWYSMRSAAYAEAVTWSPKPAGHIGNAATGEPRQDETNEYGPSSLIIPQADSFPQIRADDSTNS